MSVVCQRVIFFVILLILYCSMFILNQNNILHQSLGFPCGIIRSEIPILIDVLLHGEQLWLQFVAEVGQRVADVVRQLLIENSLKIRRSHTIHQMSSPTQHKNYNNNLKDIVCKAQNKQYSNVLLSQAGVKCFQFMWKHYRSPIADDTMNGLVCHTTNFTVSAESRRHQLMTANERMQSSAKQAYNGARPLRYLNTIVARLNRIRRYQTGK